MVSTKSLLEKSNVLSVNQTNAQIKLLEMWKATTIQDYPIEVKKTKYDENSTTTRACTNGKLIEPGKKPVTLKGFTSDATRLWNSAPSDITLCNSISSAKKAIKKFVKTLPI